jgi:membrane associated rhomboid family serine protease
MALREDIQRIYQQGDATARIILLNVGVFLAFMILEILGFLFQQPLGPWISPWLALPAQLLTLATRPWTLFTYMFFHEGFWHLVFNMVTLFFAGRMLLTFLTGRNIWTIYLLGGLMGGVLYVAAYNIFPAFGQDLAISNNRGASAGVMALVLALAAYAPQMPVRLFFVVEVRLWVIAAAFVLIDLASIPRGNSGGHLAHLGGALFGYLYGSRLKQGQDIGQWFERWADRLVNVIRSKPAPKSKLKTVYTNRDAVSSRSASPPRQKRLDEILDKISQSGYESLSKDERDFLFKMGQD